MHYESKNFNQLRLRMICSDGENGLKTRRIVLLRIICSYGENTTPYVFSEALTCYSVFFWSQSKQLSAILLPPNPVPKEVCSIGHSDVYYQTVNPVSTTSISAINISFTSILINLGLLYQNIHLFLCCYHIIVCCPHL